MNGPSPLARASLVLALTALAACVSRAEMLALYKYSVPEPAAFLLGGLRVEVLRAQSAAGATNYIVDLSIRNVGQEAIEFDPSVFELVDDETGVQYPRFVPTGPYAYGLGVLPSATLKPGRAVEGRLYFQSAQGKAHARRLAFFMGDDSVYLHNEGLLTQKELNARAEAARERRN